jgi:hypothetical protein
MSVEPLASPAIRPATAPVPPRPDEDRWPLAAWSLHEFLPIALVPFGLVLFANYLVFGFLGWDSDGGAVLVTAAQQLSLLVPIVIVVRRTRARSLRSACAAAAGTRATSSPASARASAPCSRERS